MIAWIGSFILAVMLFPISIVLGLWVLYLVRKGIKLHIY